jgi:hypothetical protein
LGPEAKDLVRRMLKLDPAERASLPEILNHVWMRSAGSLNIDDITTPRNLSAKRGTSQVRFNSEETNLDGVEKRDADSGDLSDETDVAHGQTHAGGSKENAEGRGGTRAGNDEHEGAQADGMAASSPASSGPASSARDPNSSPSPNPDQEMFTKSNSITRLDFSRSGGSHDFPNENVHDPLEFNLPNMTPVISTVHTARSGHDVDDDDDAIMTYRSVNMDSIEQFPNSTNQLRNVKSTGDMLPKSCDSKTSLDPSGPAPFLDKRMNSLASRENSAMWTDVGYDDEEECSLSTALNTAANSRMNSMRSFNGDEASGTRTPVFKVEKLRKHKVVVEEKHDDDDEETDVAALMNAMTKLTANAHSRGPSPAPSPTKQRSHKKIRSEKSSRALSAKGDGERERSRRNMDSDSRESPPRSHTSSGVGDGDADKSAKLAHSHSAKRFFTLSRAQSSRRSGGNEAKEGSSNSDKRDGVDEFISLLDTRKAGGNHTNGTSTPVPRMPSRMGSSATTEESYGSVGSGHYSHTHAHAHQHLPHSHSHGGSALSRMMSRQSDGLNGNSHNPLDVSASTGIILGNGEMTEGSGKAQRRSGIHTGIRSLHSNGGIAYSSSQSGSSTHSTGLSTPTPMYGLLSGGHHSSSSSVGSNMDITPIPPSGSSHSASFIAQNKRRTRGSSRLAGGSSNGYSNTRPSTTSSASSISVAAARIVGPSAGISHQSSKQL